jgi:hypothetical protein
MLKTKEALDCEIILKSTRVRIEEISGEAETNYLNKVRNKKAALNKNKK